MYLLRDWEETETINDILYTFHMHLAESPKVGGWRTEASNIFRNSTFILMNPYL
ncbi:MAG: hypothetical protein K0Q79_2068 [Flavipsychrobacter sp.]|jgi:hypothetical protein|nr:hypothetical protein [Flavipsychrobacter sp.]